jgi:thymidylate kinase
MIIAIEGVDCAGKTTLFNALRGRVPAVFVPSLPLPKELWPVMPWVELRQVSLWEHLYDQEKLYICDRSVFTSAPVYDALMRRPFLLDLAPWKPRVRVLYLHLDDDEIRRRFAERGDEHIGVSQASRIKDLYQSLVLPIFPSVQLNAELPLADLVELALSYIHLFRHEEEVR